MSKPAFYRRWIANEFGNRLRCWYSLKEVEADGYTGKVGLRYQTPGSPFCRYDLDLDQVPRVMDEFVRQGADSRLFTIGEAAPDWLLTMNAEVVDDERGFNLHYSRHKAQMRISLAARPEYASGIKARALMRHFCDPSSYEDIQALLEQYPDHVVEFSTYTINLGNIPNRNTLIWEVRKF